MDDETLDEGDEEDEEDEENEDAEVDGKRIHVVILETSGVSTPLV